MEEQFNQLVVGLGRIPQKSAPSTGSIVQQRPKWSTSAFTRLCLCIRPFILPGGVFPSGPEPVAANSNVTMVFSEEA